MRRSRDKERRTAVIRKFRIGSGRENGTEATNSAGGRCGLKREQAPGGGEAPLGTKQTSFLHRWREEGFSVG